MDSEEAIVSLLKQRLTGVKAVILCRGNGLSQGAKGRSDAHAAWLAYLERGCREFPRIWRDRMPERNWVPHAERCAEYTGEQAAEPEPSEGPLVCGVTENRRSSEMAIGLADLGKPRGASHRNAS